MQPRRDSVAVAAAKRGDERAFTGLFRAVQPLLLRYLRVTAGQAAEDLAAETWVRVAGDLSRFCGGDDDFRAWVFTIARHRRLDHDRARGRDRGVLVADVPEVPDPQDVPALAEEIISTEAALRLIGCLPSAQAEVVMLRVVAGLDVATVAQVTGRRAGSVRVLAHRGLRQLQQILARSDERVL